MHTSKLKRFWHQLSFFITTLSADANCKFMQLVDLLISCCVIYVYTGYQTRKCLHTGINMGVLKYFDPWVMFWSGRMGNILSPGVNFESKKVMNYFKSLYQIDLNILKHFEQKNQTIKFVNKMFQYLHIVYYWHAPLQPLSKNRFYFFFSSSDKQIFHHLLGCCSIGIYSAL